MAEVGRRMYQTKYKFKNNSDEENPESDTKLDSMVILQLWDSGEYRINHLFSLLPGPV